MGTSRSYDGPGDRPPLLPPWATGGGGPDGPPPDPGDPDGPPAPPVPPPTPPPGRPWQQAKTNLTRYANGSSPGNAGLSRAGQSYVGARGGAGRAAGTATAGRSSVDRAGQFYSALAGGGGLTRALETIGLRGLTGQPAEEVFAAIADALAPDGATLEEAAARRAVTESLSQLFAERVADGGLESLESMTPADVAGAVQNMVAAYVYHRWLEELGLSIERGATTAAEAVRMEREMRAYVRDLVQLELPAERAVTTNWEGPEGQSLVRRLFDDAYSLLEAGA
jgi:hypothetical protein